MSYIHAFGAHLPDRVVANAELAAQLGCTPEWIESVSTVAITAGASAPEVLVQDVVRYLQGKGYGSVEEIEVMPENVRFGLPPEIIKAIGSTPVAQPNA